MEFSVHYPPFEEKTVIALTNTEKARILSVFGREVEELETITVGTAGEGNFDASKAGQLETLGKKLSKKLDGYLKNHGFTTAILCVPEVNREQLQSAMDPAVLAKCSQIISKNLCAMKLDVVMRILLEG